MFPIFSVPTSLQLTLHVPMNSNKYTEKCCPISSFWACSLAVLTCALSFECFDTIKKIISCLSSKGHTWFSVFLSSSLPPQYLYQAEWRALIYSAFPNWDTILYICLFLLSFSVLFTVLLYHILFGVDKYSRDIHNVGKPWTYLVVLCPLFCSLLPS